MRWRSKRSDDDFAAEIRTHIELEADEQTRQGLPEREARDAAHRAFGNVTITRERFHESQRTGWLERLSCDLRYAVRGLRHTPVFTATAVLTIALGIGLSTSVFTVANELLIHRLPVGDQSSLMLLWAKTRDGRSSHIPFALDDVKELERQSRSLAAAAFLEFRGATPAPIQVGDRIYPIRVAMVSGNFFNVLESTAAVGRALRPEDDVAGAAPVAVLSHRAWLMQFGGDSTVVGRSIKMLYGGRSYTIVGVMPQGLEYPHGVELWVPLVAYGAAGGFLDVLTGELDVLARVRPQASRDLVRAELSSFLTRPEATTRQRALRGAVYPFVDVVLGSTKPAVLLVTLAAMLLLVVACVNVANLLLVRTLGRLRELTVRTTLGASRGRIVAQLLTESTVLAIGGGLVGAVLAVGAVKAFALLAPGTIPRIDDIRVSGVTLLSVVLVTSITMLVSGIGPALYVSRLHTGDESRSGDRHTGSRKVRKAAETLVVAQIALAVTCLTAAGLVTRSLVKLQTMDLSFDSRHLLVASIVMRPDRLPDGQQQSNALELAVSNTELLEGVRAVTPVISVPFIGADGGVDGRLALPSQSADEAAKNPIVNMEVAASNYFAMLGIPILRGRAFVDLDRKASTPVIIVSSSVAAYFWPRSNTLGQHLKDADRDYTVVGVVPDTRYREVRSPRPTVYFPLRQSPFDVPSTILIRTANSPASVVAALRSAISSGNPDVDLLSAASLDVLREQSSAQPRLNALLLDLFGATSLLLAAVGLFAILATLVRQRTREIGIRMALGATSGRVGKMIVVRALSLALIGVVIGLACAVAARRLLSALLFETSPADGTTFVAVVVVMLVVAAIAALVPAYRSARVDPLVALRGEV